MSYAIPSLTRVPATEKGLTIGDFLVPVRVGERTSPRIRHALLIAAGAIFIFLCAKVSVAIPGNPVPYTLQNFGVLVVGGALGLRRGGAAAVLYVLLGLVGLPFFAEGKGGIQVIWGATGGYIVGFVVAAAASSLTMSSAMNGITPSAIAFGRSMPVATISHGTPTR
jgi:biotin transport system substrate-specific component